LAVAVAVVEKRVTAASGGTSDGASGGGEAADNTVDGTSDAAQEVALTLQEAACEASSGSSDGLDSISDGLDSISDGLDSISNGLSSASDWCKSTSDTGSGTISLEGASDLAEEGEKLSLVQLVEVEAVGEATSNEAIGDGDTLSERIGGRTDGDTVEETALAVSEATGDGSNNFDTVDGVKETTLGVA
jgi:uncharacterized phage infection (PIP) family protein YhgE